MRTHGRRDHNHQAIVRVLRDYRGSVLDLADVGGGAPDLLVGFRGVNFLIEVKNIDQDPNKQKLTPAQELFVASWRGAPVHVIKSPHQAELWCRSVLWEEEVPAARKTHA